MNECAKIEAERAALLVEIREVDAQIQRFGTRTSFSNSVDAAERRRRQAATLRAEAGEMSQKWFSIEQSFEILAARAELYKAASH